MQSLYGKKYLLPTLTVIIFHKHVKQGLWGDLVSCSFMLIVSLEGNTTGETIFYKL